MSAAVLLFAKEPRPGRVKTRLVPPLDPVEAADLAAAFLRDQWETLRTVRGADVVVAVTDDSSVDAIVGLLGKGTPVVRQGPGTLGERLARASRAAFDGGSRPVAVVGADHPDLPASLVTACLDDARRGRVGWIPTRDGGYAALALPRPLPALFEEIPWSTAGVAPATRARASRLGVELVEHGPWYDVDTLEDLGRLSGVVEAGAACPATRAALARLDPPLSARSAK